MNIAVDKGLIYKKKNLNSSQDHPGRFVEPLGVFLGLSRALPRPKNEVKIK